MSLVLRYVFKGAVRENVVVFINFHDYVSSFDGKIQGLSDENSIITLEPKFTEDILEKAIVSVFEDLNLNYMNFLGVVTYGCSFMTSALRSVVQKVQHYASHTAHCPCSNRSLNLLISKSLKFSAY